jgi:hypothetical protein
VLIQAGLKKLLIISFFSKQPRKPSSRPFHGELNESRGPTLLITLKQNRQHSNQANSNSYKFLIEEIVTQFSARSTFVSRRTESFRSCSGGKMAIRNKKNHKAAPAKAARPSGGEKLTGGAKTAGGTKKSAAENKLESMMKQKEFDEARLYRLV